MQTRYTLRIPANCIEKGLRIIHVAPIIISAGACCGENLTLFGNCGIVTKGVSRKAPEIGDNCVIGLSAVVCGDIRLENNVAIGAGAVVVKSCKENNVTLIGVPAQVVKNSGSSEWYVRKENVT